MAQVLTEVIMTAYERLQKLIQDGNIYTKSQLDAKLDEIRATLGTYVADKIKEMLDDGVLTNLTIAEDSLDTVKFKDGAATTPKISDEAVTKEKIAKKCIDISLIKDGETIKSINNLNAFNTDFYISSNENNLKSVDYNISSKVKQISTTFRELTQYSFINVGGATYEIIDTPASLSKISENDKACKVIYPVKETGLTYTTVALSTSAKYSNVDSTLFLECVCSVDREVKLQVQYGSIQVKDNVILTANKPVVFILKLPKYSTQPSKCSVSIYPKIQKISTEFNITISRFALMEGYENLTSIPISINDYYNKVQSTMKNVTPGELPNIKAYIDKTDSTKTSVSEIIYPKYIYTVSNDIVVDEESSRQHSTAIYLDHLVKTVDDTTRFKNQNYGKGDRVAITSYTMGNVSINLNKGVSFYEEDKVLELQSEKYIYPSITIKHRSTKASVGKTTYPKVLFFADSITDGVGCNSKYGENVRPYWSYVRDFFEMDKIDGGNVATEYNFKSLGYRSKAIAKINYNGVTKEIKCSADGYPTWGLNSHLHYSNLKMPSQANWDLLGLGDGTGSDYKGTAEQKMLFATTNEVYTGDKPGNVFFDNNKTGAIKFSIAKWLERCRTCDDDGNKLTLSSTNKGTLITTQDMLDNIDVCTPTHIIVQHGTNDLTQVGLEPFIANLKLLIQDINTNYPNVYLGIAFVDQAGTYFKDRYFEFNEDISLSTTRKNFDCAKRLEAEFGNMENQKVYLIPNYYVQPTAFSYALKEANIQNEKIYRKLADYPETHVGEYAHRAWAYQVYSWLKYTMTL